MDNTIKLKVFAVDNVNTASVEYSAVAVVNFVKYHAYVVANRIDLEGICPDALMALIYKRLVLEIVSEILGPKIINLLKR